MTQADYSAAIVYQKTSVVEKAAYNQLVRLVSQKLLLTTELPYRYM